MNSNYKKPKIYLAGKADLTFFRESMMNDHRAKRYEFINPITAIDHNLSQKIIIDLDLTLISNSDCVIAYMNEYSAGTCMEIFYARKYLIKPVIVITNEPKFENDIWLNGLGCEFVDSMDKAFDMISVY